MSILFSAGTVISPGGLGHGTCPWLAAVGGAVWVRGRVLLLGLGEFVSFVVRGSSGERDGGRRALLCQNCLFVILL